MLKSILMASLAAGALAINAPAALADAPTVRCGFDSNQQDSVTGQNYEGVAYGVIAHAEGGSVSIRCYITVNGAEASSTGTGTGTGVAATAGRVTFQAADTDVVEICAEYTSDHGSGTNCVGSNHFQIPPQEVLDLLNSVLSQVDPTICPVIGAAAGSYGPITIDSTGDVSVNGGLFYDCPPYEIV